MLYLLVFWLWRFVLGGCWRPLVVCYVKRSAANVARGTADVEPNQTRALIWLCWHPADHRTEQLLWDSLLTLIPAVIALLCLSLTMCPSFRMTLWRDLPVCAMWLFSHTMYFSKKGLSHYNWVSPRMAKQVSLSDACNWCCLNFLHVLQVVTEYSFILLAG